MVARRTLLVFIVFLLVTMAAIAETSDWRDATVVNCDEWISLRSDPSTSSARIAQIPLGENVRVIPNGSYFYLCEYKQQIGYVIAKYIKLNEKDSAAANTSDYHLYEKDSLKPGADQEQTEIVKQANRKFQGDGIPSWINDLRKDAYVVPHAHDFITLRSSKNKGATIRKIGKEELMKVLGWDGANCLVEIVSTGEVGYVNSGYIAASGLDTSRWPYDYETMLEDQVMIASSAAASSEILNGTADERGIIVTRIGDEKASHHILIQCAMHAREIMTSRLGGDLILMLLNDFPGGIEDVCVHIIPLVNPDGQQIALYGPDAIRDLQLRQSVYGWLNNNNFYDWKANAQGVDINRNFDAGWNALSGRTAGLMRYRGPMPHSERESQALVDYVSRYPFDCTISIHSYGSLIYWMGGEGELKEKTKSLADAVVQSTGYQPVNSESNVEKGGFKDWAIEKAGIPSVTIEIGTVDSIGSLEEYSAIALRFRHFVSDISDWVKDNGD